MTWMKGVSPRGLSAAVLAPLEERRLDGQFACGKVCFFPELKAFTCMCLSVSRLEFSVAPAGYGLLRTDYNIVPDVLY